MGNCRINRTFNLFWACDQRHKCKGICVKSVGNNRRCPGVTGRYILITLPYFSISPWDTTVLFPHYQPDGSVSLVIQSHVFVTVLYSKHFSQKNKSVLTQSCAGLYPMDGRLAGVFLVSMWTNLWLQWILVVGWIIVCFLRVCVFRTAYGSHRYGYMGSPWTHPR